VETDKAQRAERASRRSVEIKTLRASLRSYPWPPPCPSSCWNRTARSRRLPSSCDSPRASLPAVTPAPAPSSAPATTRTSSPGSRASGRARYRAQAGRCRPTELRPFVGAGSAPRSSVGVPAARRIRPLEVVTSPGIGAGVPSSRSALRGSARRSSIAMRARASSVWTTTPMAWPRH